MGVRVECRPLPFNASQEQKDKAFKSMFAAFKRLVNENGILTEYNRRLSYESEGEKLRRKRRESELQRKKEKMPFTARRKDKDKKEDELQTKLREHFGQG